MARHYLIYGRRLEANQPIFGPLSSTPVVPDIVIEFGSLPEGIAQEPGSLLRSGTAISVRLIEAGYYFAYADGYEFLVSHAANRVVASLPPGGTLEDASTYLLGPVMGWVLRLQGFVALHASAVVVEGKAIVFCGGPGAGKSTTAAAFAQRGIPVLAEDITALDTSGDRLAVLPGYPRVNLWPESASALCGSAESLPAITPTWAKRYLPLDSQSRFHTTPAELAAIYLIRERRPDVDPRIESIPEVEAAVALAANTYTAYMQDPERRAGDFRLMTSIVQKVPVRRVFPPADIAHVGRLCDCLLEDCRGSVLLRGEAA